MTEDGIKYLPATATRCGIVYVDHSRLHDEFSEMTFGWSRVGGACLQKPAQVFGLDLPAGTLIFPKLPPDADYETRLQYGSIIAHEFAHDRGGDEWAAYNASRAYLRRSGLQGPTDRQIAFMLVEPGYHAQGELQKVTDLVFGEAKSWWQKLKIDFAFIFGRRYDLSEDIKRNGRTKRGKASPSADAPGELSS